MRHCCALLILFVVFTTNAVAQESADAARAVVARVTAAGRDLLATLDETQREKLTTDFDDVEQRRRWSNLPTTMAPRGGVRMGDLTTAQRGAVYALVRATLSPRGYQQVMDNLAGADILKSRSSGRGRSMFGRDEFYVAILGVPSTKTPWMWQFGGHHLGINATIVGDRITLSPSLTGGQPMDFVSDGRTVRQLGVEEDLALELVGTLTPVQRRLAVLGDKPVDLAFGPGRDGAKPKPEGIGGAKLKKSQRRLLLRLIRARVGILNRAFAEPRMERIANDLDNTRFAWFGPTSPGAAATFRIQGPTVVIEYSPQQLGGDLTQHTHAIYRDPTNDYGAGLVRRKRRSL